MEWITNLVLVIVIFFVFKMMMKTKFDVDARRFKSLMEENPKALIIDVRTGGEFRFGHIPGAKNCPLGSNELKNIQSLTDKKQVVLCYCASGARSGVACKTLKSCGFTSVYNLSGGMGSWVRAGFEVER